MPGNTFIRFDGVKPGESLQKTHPGIDGWVEITDWSWDIEAEHSAFKGTGSAVGKPTPGTLSFSHYFDSTSPEIMNRIVRGTHFDLVVLQMLKQIGVDMPSVYFEIVLGSAFITKISTKGAEERALLSFISLPLREDGRAPARLMEMEMKDGFIERVRLQASESGRSIAIKEDFSISFSELKLSYWVVSDGVMGRQGPVRTFNHVAPRGAE